MSNLDKWRETFPAAVRQLRKWVETTYPDKDDNFVDGYTLARELQSAADWAKLTTEAVCTPGLEDKALANGSAKKYDSGKLPWDLLPIEATEAMIQVLEFGATKYDAHNWRKGFTYSRVSAAALRHLTSWMRGEQTDPESGLSHLAHCMCCIAFLLTYELTGTGTDDRYKDAP
jgi:hypothetical protein